MALVIWSGKTVPKNCAGVMLTGHLQRQLPVVMVLSQLLKPPLLQLQPLQLQPPQLRPQKLLLQQ